MLRSVSWPNPYGDKRDRSTIWILFGLLRLLLLAGAAAAWIRLAALR
jgi:hypothetical protein